MCFAWYLATSVTAYVQPLNNVTANAFQCPATGKRLNELEHGTFFLKVFNDHSFMSAH